MNPEAREAIEIANRHLRGASIEKRKALSLDIHAAIIRHAETIAMAIIKEAVEQA